MRDTGVPNSFSAGASCAGVSLRNAPWMSLILAAPSVLRTAIGSFGIAVEPQMRVKFAGLKMAEAEDASWVLTSAHWGSAASEFAASSAFSEFGWLPEYLMCTSVV